MIKTKFNDNWQFSYGSGGALASILGGGGEPPKPVTLPHDASVLLPRDANEPGGAGNGYFREKNCHYIKKFTPAPEDSDKVFIIEFEGVYQNAYVYINGSFAVCHPYGYSAFFVDVTKYLKFGQENEIKVIVKNEVPSGRWYTGTGIYRDVNLIVADRLHIAPDGVRVAAVDIDEERAVIRVESDLVYEGLGVRDFRLLTELFDVDGACVAMDEEAVMIQAGEANTYRQRLYIDAPKLWDAENPYLYSYKTTLLADGACIDVECGKFGVRKLQLDPRHGLRVNGKVVNLRGGCVHHDNGIVGTADFPHAAYVRVAEMKKAGFNAIRSSHYPISRQMLRACDELGMYVMDEFSDVWTTTKVDFDYGTQMYHCWEADLESIVRKDYNHPCVIMYSIGNEIPEVGNKFDAQWGKKLTDKFRSLDDTRFTLNSMNLLLAVMDKIPQMMAEFAANQAEGATGEINSMMNNLGAVMAKLMESEKIAKMVEESYGQVDIVGLNYAAVRYVPDNAANPNRILVGSETYPGSLDENWALVEKHPFVIGDFDWTAWDYLGEAGISVPTYGDDPGAGGFYAPYPCKIAYCGDFNLLGDRRPVSYWRELIWGLRDAPYIAVQLPAHYGEKINMSNWGFSDAVRSWTWKGFEGRGIVVEVYANADEVELLLDGKAIARKKVGEEKKFIARFDTVYAPGILEAVAYKGGVEVGRDLLASAAGQAHIELGADRNEIPADGSDIAFVDLCMIGENGVLNLQDDAPITVSIEGPGVVQGFGSADPLSEENFFDVTARPYEGRLRAAVRATGVGAIKLTFTGEGLEAKSVELIAK